MLFTIPFSFHSDPNLFSFSREQASIETIIQEMHLFHLILIQVFIECQSFVNEFSPTSFDQYNQKYRHYFLSSVANIPIPKPQHTDQSTQT